MNEVYIIIVTYNGMQWLPRCLQSTKSFPVIVVDNGSTDGTVEFIKNEFPNIQLVEQKTNFGFGKANNLGIAEALNRGANFIFLLNQDAYLEENCIEKLISVEQRENQFGILSPIHLSGDEKKLEKYFSRYIGFEANPSIYFDAIKRHEMRKVYEVPFVNAAGWLLTRNCLEKVGGFDPIFFHYGEDVNYIQRVKYFGIKIGVVPEAFMIHDRKDKAIKEGKRFSKRYFLNLERRYKMLWANINIPEKEVLNEMRLKLGSLRSEKRNALLQLQIAKSRGITKEIQLIYRIKEEVLASRRRNLTGNNSLLLI